ncbi:rhomboid family intramembrane serine protease [uncultured Sulfitobacter sp.]|uniref:rhomboid family intramembrane serine protease n=1 Tax=uncultured Sulfitobacter sp. TaxID=191468 RepID=UPI002639D9D6|nr:rhomboid family intramembrane serine protease [uncultured Sulfitobacter sp.]
MEDPDIQPPVNPIPAAVVLIFMVITAVEAVLSLGEAGLVGGPGAVGWRLAQIRDYGFSDQVFNQMLAQGVWPWQGLVRFVSYPFIHQSFTSAIFGVVLLLALGKMVAEVMGQLAFLVLFFSSAIVGALTYGLLLDEQIWLTGAFPAVFGLIGGYSYVMWRHLEQQGAHQLRAFSLIGVLMGLQLVFGIFATVGMLWVADLAGFICGFLLSFVVGPGEWFRLKNRIRRD